jgi:hypothetical protein
MNETPNLPTEMKIFLKKTKPKKNKPMAPTILERDLPICGLRPKRVCE